MQVREGGDFKCQLKKFIIPLNNNVLERAK
jgi:hypothetical protein